MAHHGYESCNTLRWFFDRFEYLRTGHRKYGDPLESSRRFAQAFDLDGR